VIVSDAVNNREFFRLVGESVRNADEITPAIVALFLDGKERARANAPRFLRTWWLYPSSLRSSLPSRTGSHNGLFRETSHVVKSRRQRSIIERTQRPAGVDNKTSIAKNPDHPAFPRCPRFGTEEGAVRHESEGATHSSTPRAATRRPKSKAHSSLIHPRRDPNAFE
jgi:hypothetical protein